MRTLLILATALLLAACGQKISGTYTDKDDLVSYTFASNGKLIQQAMGMEMEADYELNGNRIKVATPQGNLIMTIQEDGSIEGPMGITLIKQKD